ncbi:hypothetical protein, partial [Thermophagus xiamenensis]|uniref:hypothetical protein n=1 Tax=Thermophagus xiamenensis TaxID=385682 RepID=UPI001C3191F7
GFSLCLIVFLLYTTYQLHTLCLLFMIFKRQVNNKLSRAHISSFRFAHSSMRALEKWYTFDEYWWYTSDEY